MIIGGGLIASAFKDDFSNDKNIVIFASGVSDSTSTDLKNFDREKNLLISALSNKKKLIYFSTCSVLESSSKHSMYIKHKIFMEEMIRKNADYLIFRLPQVVGYSINPNTLTNFLYKKIIHQEPFNIFKDCKRNIIDIDDILKIARFIINSGVNKRTINIANPKSVEVLNIVQIFERILNMQAIFSLVEFGDNYDIEIKYTLEIANNLEINFGEFYNERIIRKYYGQ